MKLRDLAGNADRFAVVCVKATGFGDNDRIVEIAIVNIDLDGRIIGTWDTLIQPGRDIGDPKDHGITPSMVLHAPTFSQTAGDIAERLDRACLVGHNVSSDIRMLSQEFERLDGGLQCGNFLDTKDVSATKRGYTRSAAADADASARLLSIKYESLNKPGSAAQVYARRTPIGRRYSRSEMKPRFGERIEDAEAYLSVLEELLTDEGIAETGRRELAELAYNLGFSDDVTLQLRKEYLFRKIDEVIETGNVDEDGYYELSVTADELGLSDDTVRRRAREFLDEPEQIGNIELDPGDEIVITGSHPEFTRTEIILMLESQGISVGKSIAKSRTKLLLAADILSESGKTKFARKHGIPIMPLDDFIVRYQD